MKLTNLLRRFDGLTAIGRELAVRPLAIAAVVETVADRVRPAGVSELAAAVDRVAAGQTPHPAQPLTLSQAMERAGRVMAPAEMVAMKPETGGALCDGAAAPKPTRKGAA
jgi:hypothetical protein